MKFGVNPATVQRALARLEVKGLVTARQGSGLLVNDPYAVGDVSLLADWLAVSLDEPAQAAAILEDILEARRVLATRLIVRHRARILTAIDELMADRQRFAEAAAYDLPRLDLEVARTLVRATGNTVVLAMINSVARAIEELPILADAMYAEPERNLSSIARVLAALHAGGSDLGAEVERVFAEVDAQTVTRFRALLEQRRANDR